ncbi:translation elongation factor 4 [Patescibacteria group bacterium]
MKQENVRNFCIIAHIDHGKSTLADRLLDLTGTIEKRDLKDRTLDSMELEQEKGITIKLKAVRMEYEGFQLNLIDTPGHVDFSYEVSRSLAACESAVLIVDAAQGIQAQTVSNVYKALEAGLTIIPVLNKIDLPNADKEKVKQDLADTFGFDPEKMLEISAKTGEGVKKLLEEIIKNTPSPQGKSDSPLQALVFDTFYDDFLGVVTSVRIKNGVLETGVSIEFMATQTQTEIIELGIYNPQRQKMQRLRTGEVGYVATGLKDIHKVKVGDTITTVDSQATPLPGYKDIRPFVFVSIYPTENDQFTNLRKALERLSLSDASLSYDPENNTALGFGFKCGFLGLLHADIVQERLEREYNLELISTTPTVEYKVKMTNDECKMISSPAEFPERTKIKQVKEPWILLNIVSPTEYVGNVITLCEERRGVMIKMEYPTENRVIFEYELPLSELVHNFFDDLKSVSSGFASLDYEVGKYKPIDVVKINILVHGEVVDPLSHIVLREKAEETGRVLLKRLKDVIPRQQFKVALQAAIGGKIIAREDIPAVRKNVLAGIYGGHRERKDKLLERQKKGKERLKRVGKVSIPQEAFRQVLRSS